MRNTALVGSAESSDSAPGAPDDRPVAAMGSDGGGGSPPGNSDGGPGSSDGGGGPGPQPSQQPPASATAAFDAAGNLASYTVTDVGDTQPWSSFRTLYDPQGNVLAQIGLDDGGSFWINVYDPDGQNRFDHTTDVYDAAGRLVSHTQTNLDGTHTLTVHDTANTQTWSTFNVTFDADWNQTSLTATNHDGTHTVDANAIQSFMDTLTWYANPHVVDGASPPTDDRGSPGELVAMLAAPDPRAGDPFAAAFGALQDGLATANGRGGAAFTPPAPGSDGSDALAAFLAGLQGLVGDGGKGAGAGSDGPLATLLSNGLNADAGVAQLVSALAGLHDGNSAFDMTPFGAPNDQPSEVTIAAVPR